jgi:nucleoside-diphosphate-sugar epimerase
LHVDRVFAYLKRMDDGRPVILLDKVHAQWRWSRGYVEDVAEAVVSAVLNDRAASRIYNIRTQCVSFLPARGRTNISGRCEGLTRA